MKFLLMFLIIPFLLNATCEEVDEEDTIGISLINATFIQDNSIILEKFGHQWKPVYFIHSHDCPCLESKAYIPGIY